MLLNLKRHVLAAPLRYGMDLLESIKTQAAPVRVNLISEHNIDTTTNVFNRREKSEVLRIEINALSILLHRTTLKEK